MPRQPRHGYAADLHHGLRTGDFPPASGVAHQDLIGGRALLTDPSARFRAGTPLTGLCHWFTLVTPSRLDCRAQAVWQYQPVPSLSGLLPPFLASPRSGFPHLHGPAATGSRRSPFISARSYGASWRTKSSAYLISTGEPFMARWSAPYRAPAAASIPCRAMFKSRGLATPP
jgi:hypothetical protein